MQSREAQSGPAPQLAAARRPFFHWLRLATALLPALGVLLLLAAWLPARGHGLGTQCVRLDGSGGCFTTIQAAVDAALPGDGIVIAPGVYTESVVIAKSLMIRGGWEPAGMLTRTVIHSAGGCALDLTGMNGQISDLTLRGGSPAVLCGLMVADLTLARLDISGGLDGLSLLVAGPLTQLDLQVHDNTRDGLNYLCLGGAGEVVRSERGRYAANGRYGVSGGEGCDSVFADAVVADNGAAGFYGFGGACPVGRSGAFDTQLLLRRAAVTANGVGIDKACGGLLQIEQSWVSDQVTGTRVASGVHFQSSNSIYVNNDGAAWFLSGAATAVSRNDTFADNGDYTLAMWPDALNCFLAPQVTVANSILWSTSNPVGAPAGRPCLDDPAYHVTLSYTLLISAPLVAADPQVALGIGVSDADPAFGDAAYRVTSTSPAVDSGGGDFPLIDHSGVLRPQDGNGDGLSVVDRGAYELPATGHAYFFPLASSAPAKP